MKVKVEVDDTLDGCGAAIIGDDHKEACFTGIGQESISALFKPLQSGPSFDIPCSDQLDLSDLELDQGTLDVIQERAKALFVKNKTNAVKTLQFSQKLFCKLYKQLARLANVPRQ